MALQLRTFCLKLLQQGSSGLMAAIEYLSFFVEDVVVFDNNPSQETADVFMEVQRAIMLKLISTYEETGDQTGWIDFFELLSNALYYDFIDSNKLSFRQMCKMTKSNTLTNEEVKQILDVWAKTSDEEFLDGFRYFIRLWREPVGQADFSPIAKYKACIPPNQITCNELQAARPVTCVADARWYLPLLNIYRFDYLLGSIPNLMSTVITSNTYFVVCWWLLHQADLFEAAIYFRDAAWSFFSLCKDECSLPKNPLMLVAAGFGRLLRCTTSAMIEGLRLERSMIKPFKFFVKRTATFFKESEYDDDYERYQAFFALFSREEMGFILDCFDDETKRPPSVAQHRFFEDDEMKRRLEMVIEIEDRLPPLSQVDADIDFFPDYVTDAIHSLNCEVNTFIPKFGVYTLMDQNMESMRYNKSLRRILSDLKTELIDTPILSLITPFNIQFIHSNTE